MSELHFRESAAAGYDRSLNERTRRIVLALLRAARLAPGTRVLDIDTGTGLAAKAALTAVGPSVYVTSEKSLSWERRKLFAVGWWSE